MCWREEGGEEVDGGFDSSRLVIFTYLSLGLSPQRIFAGFKSKNTVETRRGLEEGGRNKTRRRFAGTRRVILDASSAESKLVSGRESLSRRVRATLDEFGSGEQSNTSLIVSKEEYQRNRRPRRVDFDFPSPRRRTPYLDSTTTI